MQRVEIKAMIRSINTSTGEVISSKAETASSHGLNIERAMLRARALVEAGRSRLLSFPESPARDALDRVGDYVLERKW